MSPVLQSENSDPPHSSRLRPLPTKASFCLGIAERASLGEEG